MKVNEILSEAREAAKEDNWKKSKFFPKKLEPDQSPGKIAFDNMLKDAFKSFPSEIQDYFHDKHIHVGGNTIFDSVRGFMHMFEDAEHDWMYEPTLETYHSNVSGLGAAFAKIKTELDATWTSYDALRKAPGDLPYEAYVKAVAKVRAPTISVKSQNVHTIKDISFVGYPDDVRPIIDGKEQEDDYFNTTGKDKSTFTPKVLMHLFKTLVAETEDGLFGLFTDGFTIKSKPSKVQVLSAADYEKYFG